MELNDILKYQGIELPEDATIDDYKKAFDERYLTKENAINDESLRSHFAGEITSKFARELQRTAKENGIELDEEEKKKPVADLARIVIAKKQEFYDSKLSEFESTKKKPTEELTALNEKLTGLQKRYEEELSAKSELQQELERKSNEFITFQKNFKLNQAKQSILGSLNFSENANDLLKKGFYATVNEKYEIQLGDDDTPIITDKEGNRIKDPNKHGSFLSPSDVLANELTAAGLAKQAAAEKFPKKEEPREFKKNMDNNGIVKPTYAKPSSGLSV